ncbi:MAG: response regulator [Anaerolineae bacterium]|nr:response regulator [Anaerolineae bacterium]
MTTLLLIEDDLKCANLVRKVLEPQGYTIHHAAGGLAGLQFARQVHPDIILLDMNLPDLDGKIIAVNLRGSIQKGTVPIVAFTADSGVKAKRIALALGCDDFISKPFDTRALASQLADILNRVGQR